MAYTESKLGRLFALHLLDVARAESAKRVSANGIRMAVSCWINEFANPTEAKKPCLTRSI